MQSNGRMINQVGRPSNLFCIIYVYVFARMVLGQYGLCSTMEPCMLFVVVLWFSAILYVSPVVKCLHFVYMVKNI